MKEGGTVPENQMYDAQQGADPAMTEYGEPDNADQSSTHENQAELDFGKSVVARDPKKTMIVGVIGIVIAGVLAYYFFFSGETKAPVVNNDAFPLQQQQSKTETIAAPNVLSGGGIDTNEEAIQPGTFQEEQLDDLATQQQKELPKPPASPKPPAPPKPPASPEVQAEPVAPVEPIVQSSVAQQSQQSKRTSSIMLSGGGSAGGSTGKPNDNGKSGESRSLSSNFVVSATSASSTKITKVGDLSTLIAQGKIMEAVLETPVNTNYPGPIRAVISRDVYSERGENVLIPKGSKVIGSLEGGYSAGQTRVTIAWNRVIMPDGHDIMMQDAHGAGKLGSIGTEGHVHREFLGTIGNALLLSSINIAFAKGMQEGFNVGSSTEINSSTTGANGDVTSTSTTTSDPTKQAVKQAVQDLQNTTQGWFKQNFMTKPYITLDQGTIVKIFVNQDIIFSKEAATKVNVIK